MHEYGMQVVDALGISFNPDHAANDIERIAIYLHSSHDCAHQMIDVLTYFAERAAPVPRTHGLLQERALDLFRIVRDKSRPCYITGTEDEALDALIATAERIQRLPDNP